MRILSAESVAEMCTSSVGGKELTAPFTYNRGATMQLDAATQTALLTALANATDPDAAYRSYRQVASQIEATVTAHRDREVRDKARAAAFRVPFRACLSPSEWRQSPDFFNLVEVVI